MAHRTSRTPTAAAAARVDLRELLRVKAVDSYIRNFCSEPHRLQELLEVTLCYGIHCVSRNFQLRGMTLDELCTVTKHDKSKSVDYFVRNGVTKERPPLNSDPRPLYTKPSRSWRDGDIENSKPNDMKDTHADLQPSSDSPEVFFLPNEAHKDKLDEIDFYTRVLGKAFVDVAWVTYSTRGSSLLNQAQLDERLLRVDQRKRPDLMPQTELPVCSFVEFLNAYVKKSVAGETGTATVEEEPHTPLAQASAPPPSTLVEVSAAKSVVATQKRTARVATAEQQPPRSKPEQQVQSKIQPELRAHRDKLLRIKKTQAQLMRESIARSRLAEYETRRMADGVQSTKLAVKRMPLDKITPGAAALEIVDDFIRSPLMDKFGTEILGPGPNAPVQTSRRDPLREELYGIAAHDDSFIGCKVPEKERKPSVSTKPKTRDYSGWLGDFGPRHTKTVQPVWATDAVEEAPHHHDSSDDERAHKPKSGANPSRYEWPFDVPRLTQPKPHHRASLSSSASEDDDEVQSGSDDWSGHGSAASDPVFRWLKSTVN